MTNEPQPVELLTVDEAAEILRMNRKSVYALVQQRAMPGVRRIGPAGRIIRIHRATFLAWLAEEPTAQRRRTA